MHDGAKPALGLIPQHSSSWEVLGYLQHAASLGLADPELVKHLTEMGALYPEELAGAYQAFRRRQTSDN